MTAQPSQKPVQDAPPEAGTTAALKGEPADPEPRQSRSSSLLIEIVEEAGDWSDFGDCDTLEVLIGEVGRAVAAAAATATRLPRPPAAALAVIALSDDEAVATLNAHYRGKPKPTNVLSFPAAPSPAPAGDAEPVALGDIILGAETVAAEAADMGLVPQDHLRHLIVHGLLHLLGYDHMDKAEAEAMEALETHILATIGVADPYAGSTPVEARDG